MLVVTGEDFQVDFPQGKVTGINNAAYVLQGIPGTGIVHFTDGDVIRHEIVAAIIRSYKKYDNAKKKGRDGYDLHTRK